MTGDPRKAEFSRRLDVGRVGPSPLRERVAATPAECERLARRLGLVALHRLEGTLALVRRPGGLIRLDGELDAEVRQTCVVTLEPFDSPVHDTFTLYFTEREEGDRGEAEVDLLDDEAWPEPVSGGAIDLGETVAQQLSLALDPHPRAPGAQLDAADAGADDGDGNPFRALADRLAGGKRRN